MDMEKRTVLIVTNDPRMKDFAHDCAWQEPFNVQVAPDRAAALAFLQSNAVHIILIDIDLPENQGQTLLKQVEQQYPGTIRLIMSNRTDVDFVLTAASEGNVYRYLIRPLEDYSALKLLINHAAAQYVLRQKQRERQQRLEAHAQQLEKQIQEQTRRLVAIETKVEIGTHALQVVHNLNACVGNIFNSLEIIESLLADEHPDPNELAEFLTNAKTSVMEFKEIIAEILIHAGSKRDCCSEKVDINRLIRQEQKFLELNPHYKYEIDRKLDLQDNLPPVWGHPLQLKQIIDNLINNAVDAMDSSARKQLRIETRVDQQEVVVAIADTGQGIPAKDLPNIFSPDFTTKPIGKGTGLGLASVKCLLAANNGDIEVRSREGQGTIATIRLPIDRRTTGTDQAHPVGNNPLGEISATL
jgi:signal transduction histidine kinase